MPSEEDHHSERNGAAKPFFSGGKGDPTASYGDAAIGPGAQIGPYKLLGILGEGGYGIVYLAQQDRPIRRRVALKVVKPGMDSRQVIARFEAEKQALALLDHPNLAHVYDAGTTETGRPYFAMEYIEGLPITEYCDREKLSIRQRLQLFLQVCQAVQHAHQKGFIHRDLKPSNILVAATHSGPLVKVIDFGIAKALAQPLTDRTLYTQQGQFIGTPDYMSPEQAEMDAQGVDTRSDVYSLGVVLYELLTGVLPFDPDELRTGGLRHMQVILQDQQPKTPSTRLTGLGDEGVAIAARRLTNVRTLAHSLRRELEWIPLKAMRKEPSRRYPSPSQLVEDIQNYLQGKPLMAGPESASYRLKKSIRRHATAISLAAGVFLTLLIGLAVIVTLYLRSEARNESLRRANYAHCIALAQAAYRRGDATQVRTLLTSCPRDLRGWEWEWLSSISDESEVTLTGWPAYNLKHPYCVRVSPDGKKVYAGGCDGALAWNLADGQAKRFPHKAWLFSIALDPQGKRLATAGEEYGNGECAVRLWDTATGEELMSLSGHENPIKSVNFSPDGQKVISGSGDKTIRTWETGTGKELMTLTGHTGDVESVVYSPDGERIISASSDRTIKVWDATTGSESMTLTGHLGKVFTVACSPDNTIIASGGEDGTIRIWDALTGSELRMLQGHGGGVSEIAFSPDSRRIVSASQSEIRVWDVGTGMVITSLHGHSAAVFSVVFSPDGSRIVSGSWDKTVKLWNPDIRRQYAHFQGHTGGVQCVAFSPDGKRVISGSDDKTVKVWDVTSACEVGTLCGHDDTIYDLAYNFDGSRIVSASADGQLKIWDSNSGREVTSLVGHAGGVRCVDVSPDGRWIASGGEDRSITIWDAASGTILKSLSGHSDVVRSVAFSPSGNRLVSGGEDGCAKLWDTVSGQELGSVHATEEALCDVTFMPNGKSFVTAAGYKMSPGRDIDVWSVADLRLVMTLPTITNAWSAAVTPDGRRILNGRRIWDAFGGTEILTLPGSATATSVAVSPDGKAIVIRDGQTIMLLESSSPIGGYGPRIDAASARQLVDELHERCGTYGEMIQRLEDHRELSESIRKFALQISRSRLSAELYYSKGETVDR